MFLKYGRNLLLKFVKLLLLLLLLLLSLLLFLFIKESSEKFHKSCCHEINKKKDKTMAKCILSLSKMCLKLGKYTLTVKLNNSGAQRDLPLFIETT